MQDQFNLPQILTESNHWKLASGMRGLALTFQERLTILIITLVPPGLVPKNSYSYLFGNGLAKMAHYS